MATVSIVGVFSYGQPSESAVLAPGASRAVTWSSDAFATGAVVLTPHPTADGIGQVTMRISDVETWTITSPLGPVSSGLTSAEHFAGANVTNIGSTPIKAFTVTVAVIRPGPDGH